MVKLRPEPKSALHLHFLWMGIKAFSLQKHPKADSYKPEPTCPLTPSTNLASPGSNLTSWLTASHLSRYP